MHRALSWASVLLVLVFALSSAVPAAAAGPEGAAMRWPTSGRVTQRYGCTGYHMNRRVGRCRFHDGIDIANRAGTPIRAARAGVVAFVGWNPHDPPRQRAWIVIVNHGGGLRTWYAHMLPRRVNGARRGDRVGAGELIGYMGSTGRASGVHLHFAVQRGGRFVSPGRYLRGRPAGVTRRTSAAGVPAADLSTFEREVPPALEPRDFVGYVVPILLF